MIDVENFGDNTGQHEENKIGPEENKMGPEENKFPDDPFGKNPESNLKPIEDGEAELDGQKPKKHKQTSWDDYAERLKIDYKAVKDVDDISSTITIYNIPNIEEFQELITVLKDENGSRFIEFAIADCGFGRFYYLYKSSKLFDIIQLMKQINRTFYSESVEQYQIRLTESILSRNKSDRKIILHMSTKQRAVINRLLQDIHVSDSSFGLVMCIATLNKAKEKFDRYITEKYEVYYSDDGYFKLIKREINRATVDGIDWLINTLPIMVDDVAVHKKQYLYDITDQKITKKLLYKLTTVDDTIKLITEKEREIPAKCGLDYYLHKDEITIKQPIPIPDNTGTTDTFPIAD